MRYIRVFLAGNSFGKPGFIRQIQHMAQRFRSFWYGLTLPISAARLILGDKALLLWSLLPIIITVVLYVYVIGSMQDWAHGAMEGYFAAWGWDPQGWAAWFFGLVFDLLLLLVSALTFAFSSSIVASPFNDFLAEKSEKHAEPELPPVTGKGLGHQLHLILIDLAKAMASAVAGIAALLLSWIPVVNMVAFVFAFILVTFQYTSYPQTRRGVKLRDGIAFLWNHIWACAGLGATISFFYALPFVATVALPVAVVSGTLLVARAPGRPGDQKLLPLK